MIINELFTSIDGESKRAGELATFIRATGCPLRCSYCDSKYSWQVDENCQEMSIDEIINKCKEFEIHNITFTGGEPLIQKDADELIEKLANEGFDVSIETCGAIDFTNRSWFINNTPNVWVCVDYKCYSSGETNEMLPINKFKQLRSQDVIKFVVGSVEDLNLTKEIISKLRENDCNCYVYISPVFGNIEPVDIVNYMMENKLQDKIKFQLQLHKFVWSPDMRGV